MKIFLGLKELGEKSNTVDGIIQRVICLDEIYEQGKLFYHINEICV